MGPSLYGGRGVSTPLRGRACGPPHWEMAALDHDLNYDWANQVDCAHLLPPCFTHNLGEVLHAPNRDLCVILIRKDIIKRESTQGAGAPAWAPYTSIAYM